MRQPQIGRETGADQRTTEAGIREAGGLVFAGISVPLKLFAELTRGFAAPPEGQPRQRRYRPPGHPLTESRSNSLDVVHAFVAMLIRALETAGTGLGGRANTVSFQGPGDDDTGEDGARTRITSPLATVAYLAVDVMNTFRAGIERGADRVRHRR